MGSLSSSIRIRKCKFSDSKCLNNLIPSSVPEQINRENLVSTLYQTINLYKNIHEYQENDKLYSFTATKIEIKKDNYYFFNYASVITYYIPDLTDYIFYNDIQSKSEFQLELLNQLFWKLFDDQLLSAFLSQESFKYYPAFHPIRHLDSSDSNIYLHISEKFKKL